VGKRGTQYNPRLMKAVLFQTRIWAAVSAIWLSGLACNETSPSAGGTVTLSGPVSLAEPVQVQSPLDVNVSEPLEVHGQVALSHPVTVSGPIAVQGQVGLSAPVQLQQPVEISAPQPLRFLSADTDVSRLVFLNGRVDSSTGPTTKLLEGPFVLTDATNTYTFTAQPFLLYVVPGTTCRTPGSPAPTIAVMPDSNASVHGARILIPESNSLCIHAYGTFAFADYTVSGFRPY
jgi:hypothetical protein